MQFEQMTAQRDVIGRSRKGLFICALLATAAVGCESTLTAVEETDTLEQQIIGGRLEDRFPAVVYIERWRTDLQRWSDPSCTGTLIAPNAVLTAAHCVDDAHRRYRIGFGRYSPNNPVTYVKPDGIFLHPGFVIRPSGDVDNDIAVLILERSHHVPMPRLEYAYEGQRALAVGYGREGTAESTDTNRRKSYELTVYHTNVDHEGSQGDEIWSRGEEGGLSKGDSGGPLLSRDGTELFGVASKAYMELNGRTTHTEAADYRQWVSSRLAQNPPPPLPAGPMPPTTCGVLRANEGLTRDGVSSLASCNGRFQLVLQSDSNLVLYDHVYGRPIWWAPGAYGSGASYLYMQSDGNLVLYTASWNPVWATYTYGAGTWLAVQDDGNLVLYSPYGSPIWATHTVQPPPPADTTPPGISSNIGPAHYRDVVYVSVQAWDDRSGIAYVQMLVDGVHQGTDDSSPYEFWWNTTAFSSSGHTVTFLATDGAGNVGRSDVAVQIDNQAPTVYFPYPGVTAYEGMGYTPPVKATDLSGVGVARVEFYVNGVFLENMTYYANANPSAHGGDWYAWSFASYPPGGYSVTAKAFDAFGNQATASTYVHVAPWDVCAYGCSPECPDLCG